MRSQHVHLLQIVLLLLISIGLMNHMLILSPLIQTAKRDAWLSVLIAGSLSLLWIPLLYYIMNSIGKQPMLVWLKRHGGSLLTVIIVVPIVLYLLMMMFSVLKHTCSWTKSAYLPMTPTLVITAVNLLFAYFAVRSGLRAISITAGLLLPLAVALIFFLAGANLVKTDYSYLLPMLQFGWSPVLKGAVISGSGLAELFILLLLRHYVQSRIKLWPLMLTGTLLAASTLWSIVQQLAQFGPIESSHQLYIVYESWRLVEIGKYIEHLDFLSVFQWVAGSLMRLSLALFLIQECFRFRNDAHRRALLLSVCALMLFLTQLPISDHQLFPLIMKYYIPTSLLFVIGLTALLAVIARRAHRKGGHSNEPSAGGA